MIDEDDADFALLAGVGTPGLIGLAIMIVAVVFYYLACQNGHECEKRHCDVGKPVLAHNECVCETLAK